MHMWNNVLDINMNINLHKIHIFLFPSVPKGIYKLNCAFSCVKVPAVNDGARH